MAPTARTDAAMSRKSYSSMKAHNGSAASSYAKSTYYSDAAISTLSYTPNGQYPRRYDGSAVASQHAARSQRLQGNSHSSSGESNENSDFPDGHRYYGDSTETSYYDYQPFVSQESHYLSPSFTESQVTEYPPEITIDEDQQLQASNGEGNEPTYCSHNQGLSAMDQAYYTDIPTQDSDQTYSTTNSWSTQQLTEERLRLGLTRWVSEEQQHAEYEKVLRRS